MYGYTAFVPVALWGVLKWYGSESANLLECLALYGYANLIWVPVAIASASPITSMLSFLLLEGRGRLMRGSSELCVCGRGVRGVGAVSV